jgi:hypothetical protein
VGEQQDGLGGVVDELGGEAGVVFGEVDDGVFAGDVGGGDDGELGPVDGWVEGDGGDAAEQPDAVVVDVELVPGEAVAGADRVGVVVVVPAFAAGEQGDPPVVAGVVLGLEAALAPEVGGGVDQPGGVQADDDAEEGSPEQHAEMPPDGMAGGRERGAEGDLQEAGDGERSQWYLRARRGPCRG